MENKKVKNYSISLITLGLTIIMLMSPFMLVGVVVGIVWGGISVGMGAWNRFLLSVSRDFFENDKLRKADTELGKLNKGAPHWKTREEMDEIVTKEMRDVINDRLRQAREARIGKEEKK